MPAPVLPRYEASSIGDVLPSLSGRFGLPGFDDVLELPASDRYVILLVDGLGTAQLQTSGDAAPHLENYLAIDPLNPGRVYAGTSAGGVFTVRQDNYRYIYVPMIAR